MSLYYFVPPSASWCSYWRNSANWTQDTVSSILARTPHRTGIQILHIAQQVELFTHCFCVQNLVQRLQKEDYRLAAVHLVDAYHCG